MSAKIDFMFKINMWYVSADQAETYDEKSSGQKSNASVQLTVVYLVRAREFTW
jgi:hypothetical protein